MRTFATGCLTMLVVASLHASCVIDGGGDDEPSRCGDGVCSAGERSTCPSDCAVAGCSALNDTCAGETICVASACVAAFPRVYQISNVQVQVPTTKPNGEPWDVGGGAPDLFLRIDGVKVTNAVPDSFSAAFPGPFGVSLIAGQSVRIDVIDEDLTVDDPAFACQANPVTASLLRGRTFGCSVSGMRLDARIDPR